MRRRTLTLGLPVAVIASLALMVGASPARADGVYHAQHIPFAPVDGASLRSGFVENIHANGPVVYAHEQYVVNGAAADTTYQVVIMIYPFDTTCSSVPAVIPTAAISTNGAGNGTAYHVFTPADADGLRGSTVGAMWFLMDGSTAVYATPCETVQLD